MNQKSTLQQEIDELRRINGSLVTPLNIRRSPSRRRSRLRGAVYTASAILVIWTLAAVTHWLSK